MPIIAGLNSREIKGELKRGLYSSLLEDYDLGHWNFIQKVNSYEIHFASLTNTPLPMQFCYTFALQISGSSESPT